MLSLPSGSNQTVIIGTAGGFCGLFFIICCGVLLYVMVRQKQRENFVPPNGRKYI